MNNLMNQQKPTKYRMLANRFDHKAGTIVYSGIKYDYGLANDDSIWYGTLHISVSLNENGDYPYFTIPIDDLVEVL